MTKQITLLFVAIAVSVATGASADVMRFNDADAAAAWSLDRAAAGPEALALQLRVNALETKRVRTVGGEFLDLRLTGGGIEGAVGTPALPVIRHLIPIPDGAEIRVHAAGEPETYRLASFGANRLAPVQAPVEKRPGARQNAGFDFDVSSYARNRWSAAPAAEVVDVGYMRGRRVGWLVVRPVSYNPARGEIRVTTDLTIDIEFVGADDAATAAHLARYGNARFDALLNRLAPGSPDIVPLDASAPSSYLVVGTADFWNTEAMRDFAAWKTSKGYDVVFMDIADVGATPVDIQSAIRDAYETWDRPPAYVLLLGDTDTVPAFVGQDFVHPATDLYYQLADDADLFPDLEVGRFPARGVEELTNMIDKTLASEWATTTPSWAANAAFLASTDNWDISEGTHDYVIEHFTGPAGYNNLRFYSDKGASTEEVLDAVQNGLTLLTYSGHGATTYWADGPKVTQTQVAELTNELFPVVFSYACVTGTYDLDESFAETWVRSAYGATAFWGASENSYWDEDDILEKAVYEGLFDGDAKSLPLSWMAAMTDFGKLAVWSHYGGEDRSLKYMKSYNIMGDPEFAVFTGTPRALDAVFSGTLTENILDLHFDVAGAAFAQVGLTRDGEVVGFGFTDGNGAALVNVFGEIRDGETLTATVTGHNLLPSIHELTVGESLPGGGDDDTGDENGDDDEAGTDNDDDGAANDSAPKTPGDGGDSAGGCGC